MSFEFLSRRSAVIARNGLVATSQPLAAQAGLRVLQGGGNAIDAAVTSAAVLAVVEPMMTGLGGDLFALVWSHGDRQAYALNASGRSSRNASIDEVIDRGFRRVPLDGADAGLSVTVPGTVDGWATLLDRFGTIKLADALEPAITYARAGFAVSEVTSYAWTTTEQKLRTAPGGDYYLPAGKVPRPGQVFVNLDLARTLEIVAADGARAFYTGELASRLVETTRMAGGWLDESDLANHTSVWESPISTEYRGVTVYQCPPNCQGVATLLALSIVNSDLDSLPPSPARLIEAVERSLVIALAEVADPAVSDVDPVLASLTRTDLIARSDEARHEATWDWIKSDGDTVYVAAVDGNGTACSLMNSVYQGFGTGIVVPGTGIALHNRGALFSLDSRHLNSLAPSKRPFNTIAPALATRGGDLWLTFGVVGGFQQTQAQTQCLIHMILGGMNPQEALDQPRFSFDVKQGVLRVEPGFRFDPSKQMAAQVLEGWQRTDFGGGQIIEYIPDHGVLVGGSDPRYDGQAVGW